MGSFLRFFTWPAIAGVLAALLILQQWVLPTPSPEGAAVARDSFRQAVASATPSVVNIYTEKRVASANSRMLNNPFMPIPRGAPRQRVERSLGSGVIMRENGYILTNNHVIDGADAIQVLLSDGRSAAAQVVGLDRATDLAALKVDLEDLSAISIADSDRLSVGDVVLAIGNPLGFGHSVTQGIVSGLGRFGLSPGSYEGFIQTDAVIHAGNSGGALVDVNGALVGINSWIYASSEGNSGGSVGIGISLAIPSSFADFVMDDLIRFGRVIRGWLGVQVEQIPGDGPGDQRLLVRGVAVDGPADRAGLQAGDIITHLNDEAVEDVRLAMYEVSLLRPGDRLMLSASRDGEAVELTAIIGTQPETTE
ncbi:trypsin-like peptidase domain-containing protein [Congregibacter litoralis]|uniref:Trypsin-like serine protease, typically periplasmic n=1 Tax=Congregibacter litoralis KT71 TaxID=314285 RepID=A4A5D6_9GAMM|nr:trypsin-like peptidase domain-containing protein [Congregibacter litoralis]EAQ99007.1 Trypsin-like serine protease, typically periplasmic [Congregibacter litoralis KT71]